MVLSGKRQKLIRTESLPPLVGTLCSSMQARVYDASGILVWKWFEQHVVDDAEDRRAGSNTKPESENRHQRKPRIALERAERVAQVLSEARHEALPTASMSRWFHARL